MIKWIKTAKKIPEPEGKALKTVLLKKSLDEPSAALLLRKHVGKNMLAVLFLVEIKLLRSAFPKRTNNFQINLVIFRFLESKAGFQPQ